MKFKKIFLFAFIWFLVFAGGEFIIKLIFNDETPTWKIISIGFISSIGALLPYLKKGRKFDFNDITKYQKKEITLNKKIDNTFLEKLMELLNINDFKIINNGKSEIIFKSKISLRNIGEYFKVSIAENRLIITSKPKFKLGLLDDNGNARKNIKKIERLIYEIIEVE